MNSNTTKKVNGLTDITLLSRSNLDAEIANHYLNNCKYGLPGSNGTWLSNYYRHTLNNHEFLSFFFADSKNPFDRKRRILVTWCKMTLTLFLSAVIEASPPPPRKDLF